MYCHYDGIKAQRYLESKQHDNFGFLSHLKLGSVKMHQAHIFFFLHDFSSEDPYKVFNDKFWESLCSLQITHINILKSITWIIGFPVLIATSIQSVLMLFIIIKKCDGQSIPRQIFCWYCLFLHVCPQQFVKALRWSELCQLLCHSTDLWGQFLFLEFVVAMALQKYFKNNCLLQKQYLAFCLCCFTGIDVQC